MKVQQIHEYDAGVDEVLEVLTSPEYLRAKAEALGDTELEIVAAGRKGDGYVADTRRVVPANIPGFAKKFLPAKNRIHQVEEWGPAEGDGSRRGTWHVSAAGAPVTGSGTARIEPTATGCRNVIEGEVKASVPLVGGKLASFVGDEAIQTMNREHAFAQKWLAERG